MSDTQWPETFAEACKALMPSDEPSDDTLAERRRIASILTAFRNAYIKPCDGCGDSHAPEIIRKPTLVLLTLLLGCEIRDDDTDRSLLKRMEKMLEKLNLDNRDLQIAESIFNISVDTAKQMDMQNLAARAATNHQPATDKMVN